MNELHLLIKNHNIDIIAITESLPKNSKDTDTSFILEGYNCICVSEGRGVCLFVRDCLDIIRLPELESLYSPSIFCYVHPPASPERFILGVLYRSPNCNVVENDKINTLVNRLFNDFKSSIILMGDFNFPEIDWSSETVNSNTDHPASKFLDSIQENYISQLVTEPTHFRALQKANTLDLVLTNNKELISSLEYLPPIGCSHHSVIFFQIEILSSQHNKVFVEKFNISKADFESIRNKIKNQDWDKLLSYEVSVEKGWFIISNIIHEAMEIHIPKTRSCTNNIFTKRLHVPSELLEKIRLKRRAFKYYKKYPTAYNYDNYVRARNLVKKETRKHIVDKERLLALQVKSNPKAFYKYVSSKTKPKESVSNLCKGDGLLTDNDSEKAELLNNFFSSVFTSEDSSDSQEFIKDINVQICNLSVSPDQMEKALNNLNISKSPGPDKLHPRILKELSGELAYPLALLFNKTTQEGKLPSAWKEAEVRPLFKKRR